MIANSPAVGPFSGALDRLLAVVAVVELVPRLVRPVCLSSTDLGGLGTENCKYIKNYHLVIVVCNLIDPPQRKQERQWFRRFSQM